VLQRKAQELAWDLDNYLVENKLITFLVNSYQLATRQRHILYDNFRKVSYLAPDPLQGELGRDYGSYISKCSRILSYALALS